MIYSSRLTSKSQVTVPKDVRDVLGVGPGSRLAFQVGDDGRVFVAAHDSEDTRHKRKAEFLARAARVGEDFRKHDPLPEMDGLTYQRFIRGDGPEL